MTVRTTVLLTGFFPFVSSYSVSSSSCAVRWGSGKIYDSGLLRDIPFPLTVIISYSGGRVRNSSVSSSRQWLKVGVSASSGVPSSMDSLIVRYFAVLIATSKPSVVFGVVGAPFFLRAVVFFVPVFLS